MRRYPIWVRGSESTGTQETPILIFRPRDPLKDQPITTRTLPKIPEKPKIIKKPVDVPQYRLLKKYFDPETKTSEERNKEKKLRTEFIASLMYSTLQLQDPSTSFDQQNRTNSLS
jgi:hypothetical protein